MSSHYEYAGQYPVQGGLAQPGTPVPYYHSHSTSYASVPNAGALWEAGKFGAVVGLCGAGAVNLHRLQADELSRREATIDTLRTGVAAGVATAAATLVASQFRGSVLPLLATLATGTALMYAFTARGQAAGEQANRDAANPNGQ